jgi:hypothetical protein
LYLCLWNTKKFCKDLVGGTHHILNHSNRTKNDEDIRLKIERDQELFFSKKLKQTITLYFFCIFCVSLYFWHSKNICRNSICKSNHTKNCSTWLRNEENIENCSMINKCLMMSDSTLVSRHGIKDLKKKNRLTLLMITTLATSKTKKKKHCNRPSKSSLKKPCTIFYY